MALLRRLWLPLASLGVVAALMATMAVLAFRPSRVHPVAHASAPPHPTPTPDPRVEEVKSAVRTFIQAFWDSAKTGNPDPVDALTVPDSQAAGNAGIPNAFDRMEHHNFMAAYIEYMPGSWMVSLTDGKAEVSVSYRLYGHDAEWPSLHPREPDHFTGVLTDHLEIVFEHGRWLVNKVNG